MAAFFGMVKWKGKVVLPRRAGKKCPLIGAALGMVAQEGAKPRPWKSICWIGKGEVDECDWIRRAAKKGGR